MYKEKKYFFKDSNYSKIFKNQLIKDLKKKIIYLCVFTVSNFPAFCLSLLILL